jgi:hypothetical protein
MHDPADTRAGSGPPEPSAVESFTRAHRVRGLIETGRSPPHP